MSKQFLTVEEVAVVKGYLSASKESVKPINNYEFIRAQQSAEYIITFAEKAKSKNFEGVKPDSLDDLRREVIATLSTKATQFVTIPKKLETPLNAKLTKEALDFINNQTEIANMTQINDFLQQFEVINEFETIGLFFEDGIVKINRIYTMKEIIAAVTSCYKLLVQ